MVALPLLLLPLHCPVAAERGGQRDALRSTFHHYRGLALLGCEAGLVMSQLS